MEIRRKRYGVSLMVVLLGVISLVKSPSALATFLSATILIFSWFWHISEFKKLNQKVFGGE